MNDRIGLAAKQRLDQRASAQIKTLPRALVGGACAVATSVRGVGAIGSRPVRSDVVVGLRDSDALQDDGADRIARAECGEHAM
jgi:hypothetical protein